MKNTFLNWLMIFLATLILGVILAFYSSPSLAGDARWVSGSVLPALAVLTLSLFLGQRVVNNWLARHRQEEQASELAREAMLIINARGIVQKVNGAFEEITGYSTGMLKGMPLQDLMTGHPPLQSLVQPLLTVLVKGHKKINHRVTCSSCSKGALLSVDYHPLYYREKLTGAIMLAQPLEIIRDKHYLFETIEAERKKISIEIHDWVGRNMSSIIHYQDYILRLHRDSIPMQLHNDLEELRSKCQSAAMDMRGIMNNIHPYLIDSVGIISALESYMADFEQTNNIKVYMFYNRRDIGLEINSSIVVYRIIQEAMSNVAKHSSATEIDIYFKEAANSLKVEIVDNGQGQDDGFVAGKGLWGMKERAVLIGGDLVYSKSGGGFYVALTIPLTLTGGGELIGQN